MPDKKRICLVGPAYPYRGGIAHYTACLAEVFVRRGHEVEVINYAALYPRLLFPGTTMMDTSGAPLRVDSRRVLKPLLPWTWLQAVREIRKFQPDIVLFQWWHVFFAPCLLSVLALVGGNLRPVTVVVCHNTNDHEKHGLLNRVANAMLLRLTRAVLVHSAREALALGSRPGKRYAQIMQLGHPPYESFQAFGRRSQTEAREVLKLAPGPLCLFFGLVRGYKGLSDLLSAISLLRNSSIRLLIAGEFYEPLEKYTSQIEELGLGSRVTVHPRYVSNEEVADYFCAADLLVAPYRSASQSGVVAISQAFNLPALVTNVGGLPEMVLPGKTGLVVPPAAPEKLARAIDSYFAENLAPKFRASLEKQIPSSSWDALCTRVEAL